jgi:dTDP-4-dehydrorhamnose 3,5-epimerase-like enzyme
MTIDVGFGLVPGPAYVRHDDRGLFEELVNTGRWECVIHGAMRAGSVLGYHYHHHTVVFYFLLAGRARIVTIDVETRLRQEYLIAAGQGFVFRPCEARTITMLEDARFIMAKSHRYDAAAPDIIEYAVR